MPLPPALFSTITCCFHTSVSFSATRRAKMSAAWPGGNGTMKCTGLLGHGACASAGAARAAPAAPARRSRAGAWDWSTSTTPPQLSDDRLAQEGARDRDCRRLRLDTIAGKMGAAANLYGSMGFVDIPPC